MDVVSLEDMLTARESRQKRQRELCNMYGCTLISFTMNIAGPIKNSFLINKSFEHGLRLLSEQISLYHITELTREKYIDKTGCTAFIVLDADALQIKKIAIDIEETSCDGRLFDIDVIDYNGRHIDRSELAFRHRKCLICGGDAKNCARSRAHSVEELQNKTNQLLQYAYTKWFPEDIASVACKAILFEVSVTPKPGLVDRLNNGSHKDMDFFTFMSSTSVLFSYFADCVRVGMRTSADNPHNTFNEISALGRLAEGKMLESTGGINTHKGAIFSIGIVCSAIGRLHEKNYFDTKGVLKECGAISEGIVSDSMNVKYNMSSELTSGQKAYINFHITGARGQAEAGFPVVSEIGLPALEKALDAGLDINRAGQVALLAIIANVDDTNIIARSSFEKLCNIKKYISSIIQCDEFPDENLIKELDCDFINENISPGGSADLLSICFMLHFLSKY